MFIGNRQRGFTIVELLIVIVVIGILAAITIVAYSGVQSRANDSKMRVAAGQIEKATNLFYIDTGNVPFSGSQSTAAVAVDASGNQYCPSSTTGSGWAASGRYLCALEDLLVARNLIPATLWSSLPPNMLTTGTKDYKSDFMFYACTLVPKSYMLMWYIQSPSSDEAANFDSVIQRCTGVTPASTTTYYTNYGMRNAHVLSF